jgi:hypothetical protein
MAAKKLTPSKTKAAMTAFFAEEFDTAKKRKTEKQAKT